MSEGLFAAAEELAAPTCSLADAKELAGVIVTGQW